VPRKRRRRRGYPVAVLIGLENKRSIFWNVFSNAVKAGVVKTWVDNEYNFFESMVDELRPSIKQGIKTVLIASDDRKKYDGFIGHIEKHQGWMLKGYELNRVSFQFVEGSAKDVDAVMELVSASGFNDKIREAGEGDMKLVMSVLEKRLSSRDGIETLMFSLDEAEDAVYGGRAVEYIISSQRFQERHRRRMQRLFQVAENKGVKTRVLPPNSPYLGRVAQFGGLICLLRIT
jgi:stalled ribosome rescue protein Dom34